MGASIAHAATIDGVLLNINKYILNPAIEIAFIVALLVFLYGLLELIKGAASEEKRRLGRQHMLWGIVGFVIMFCVYGLVTLLINTFGIKGVQIDAKKQEFNPPCIQDLKILGENQGSFLPCN